jgi:hypothetical protein
MQRWPDIGRNHQPITLESAPNAKAQEDLLRARARQAGARSAPCTAVGRRTRRAQCSLHETADRSHPAPGKAAPKHTHLRGRRATCAGYRSTRPSPAAPSKRRSQRCIVRREAPPTCSGAGVPTAGSQDPPLLRLRTRSRAHPTAQDRPVRTCLAPRHLLPGDKRKFWI